METYETLKTNKLRLYRLLYKLGGKELVLKLNNKGCDWSETFKNTLIKDKCKLLINAFKLNKTHPDYKFWKLLDRELDNMIDSDEDGIGQRNLNDLIQINNPDYIKFCEGVLARKQYCYDTNCDSVDGICPFSYHNSKLKLHCNVEDSESGGGIWCDTDIKNDYKLIRSAKAFLKLVQQKN